MAGMRGKCDPSRGGGRGRRVDGRGGRDVLPDCADDGRWRPERTGAERPSGTAACSRHDRGHTPRRRRRDGCTDGRLAVGGAGPRRRSARGDLRLDNGPEPWHNSSDRLGLSELGAVTRVRLGYNRALTPRLSPLYYATRTQRWRPTPGPWTPTLPMDAKSAPTGSLENREERGFPQRPQPASSSPSISRKRSDAGLDRTDGCREYVTFRRPLTPRGPRQGEPAPTPAMPARQPHLQTAPAPRERDPSTRHPLPRPRAARAGEQHRQEPRHHRPRGPAARQHDRKR